MLLELIRSLRLKHAVKNGFLFAGLLFAQRLFAYPDNLQVALGFVCFTLVTWAVYLLNDIQDRELDRLHPVKKDRPDRRRPAGRRDRGRRRRGLRRAGAGRRVAAVAGLPGLRPGLRSG